MTGTLVIESGVTLKIAGASGAGSNEGLLTASGDVTNAGTINLTAEVGGFGAQPAPSRLVVSTGTLTNTGTIQSLFGAASTGGLRTIEASVTNTGTIATVDDSLTLDQAGAVYHNGGSISIAASFGVAVTGSGNTHVFDFDGGTISNGGTFQQVGGAFNHNGGTASGGQLQLEDVALNPSLNAGAGTGAASFFIFDNLNTLTGNVASSDTLTVSGFTKAGNNDGILTASTAVTNAGTIELTSTLGPGFGGTPPARLVVTGGTLTSTGLIHTLPGIGGVREIAASFANQGTLDIAQSTAFDKGGASFNQTAGTTNLEGTGLDLTGSTGSLTLGGGSLMGAGTVTGTVNNTGGTVSPGNPSGTLALTSGYVQGSGGSLGIHVNGTGSGQFSVLGVGVNATLGGTLALVPSSAYAASATPGDSVTFLTYGGSRTGTFATTTVSPPLAAGKPFTASYADASKQINAVVGNPTTTSGGGSSAPPLVSSVTPASGPAGVFVGISGSNFDTATQVLFDSTPASFVIDGANHITARVPSGPSGTVNVRVINPAGESAIVAGDQFYETSPPGGSADQAAISAVIRALINQFAAYQGSSRFTVNARPVRLLSGGQGVGVTTNGSCALSLYERGMVTTARSASSRASSARKVRRARRPLGLIRTVRLRAPGAGYHVIPLKLTAKGRRLLRNHRRRRAAHTAITTVGVAFGRGDPLAVACRPISYPTLSLPLTGLPGGTVTEQVTNFTRTTPHPTGPAQIQTISVPITQPPPPISAPQKLVGWDQVGDRLELVVAAGGRSITSLKAIVRLHCVSGSGEVTRIDRPVSGSDLNASRFGTLNVNHQERTSNPTDALSISGVIDEHGGTMIINDTINVGSTLTQPGKNCGNAPGAGSFRVLPPGQAKPPAGEPSEPVPDPAPTDPGYYYDNGHLIHGKSPICPGCLLGAWYY